MLQPFADGLKAILKEQIKPLRAGFTLFIFSPILTFLLSLSDLNFICFKFTRSYFNEFLNFFFFFSISFFNVFSFFFQTYFLKNK
jgi:NADH:ubiquinone oxidoreductase subunit H